MNEKNLYSICKDSITIPLGHSRDIVVHIIAFRGVSTDSVEIIPQFCNMLPFKMHRNHVVGNGLIFESLVSGYFGRKGVD